MSKDTNETSKLKIDNWWLRNMIALIVTVLVVGATLLIAIYQLFIAETPDMAFIGQSLLPLWGTWFGTVLAFYFGKANFEAASNSYQATIKALTTDEKFAKITAREVMIPVNQIVYLEYDKAITMNIKDILNDDRFKTYNRYAILDQNKVLKYMIHRSTFLQYLFNNLSKVADLNLEKMVKSEDPEIKKMLDKGYNFIPIGGTLLDAKRAMDAKDECQDVFLTENGKPTEPVLGLITNNIIFDKSKA